MALINRTTLGIAISILSVCSTVSGVANISIYALSVEDFEAISDDFQDVITAECIEFCSGGTCGEEFNGNLTAQISNITDTKPNVNVTVVILAESGEQLSKNYTEVMLDARRLSIQTKTEQKIVSVNEKFYGIAPDDPANWIIIAVVAVFTLALLGVVLYLSKHKVNHAEEHYEEMKQRESSSDSEVAA